MRLRLVPFSQQSSTCLYRRLGVVTNNDVNPEGMIRTHAQAPPLSSIRCTAQINLRRPIRREMILMICEVSFQKTSEFSTRSNFCSEHPFHPIIYCRRSCPTPTRKHFSTRSKFGFFLCPLLMSTRAPVQHPHALWPLSFRPSLSCLRTSPQPSCPIMMEEIRG